MQLKLDPQLVFLLLPAERLLLSVQHSACMSLTMLNLPTFTFKCHTGLAYNHIMQMLHVSMCVGVTVADCCSTIACGCLRRTWDRVKTSAPLVLSPQVKLVLERARRPAGAPTWYSKGQIGRASSERDTLQLPVSFVSASTDDWSAEMAAPGAPPCAPLPVLVPLLGLG